MSVDFGFRGGPTYRPTTRNEMFQSALDLPMNQGATFFDQAKGGVLESFGLGTAIKDTFIPEGNTARDYRALSFPLVGPVYEATRAAVQSVINKPQPSLTEEQFKASPYHRDEIPYEPGMTEDRAAVLADWHDARKVREYFSTKRPITSFVGNLAGQAIDPVNYLPVLGPLVKAGAVGKFGKIFGGAITGALDASSNTAIAALATQDVRGKAGDDVSWQSTVSQIATAALIGSVFGTIGGAVEKRADTKFRAAAEERLSTLRTTQEARVALNEAIGAVVRGEDIRLSPNSTEPMARVAGEIQSPKSKVADGVEPPVPDGYVRVYHSGSVGEGETGRWVSTNRTYASNYRSDLPLHFLDIRADDPRVNNADIPEQGVKQGFTFNFETTPQEAALLKEVGRSPLVVARMMPDGSVRYGKPGQIHADLVDLKAEGRISPVAQEDMGFAVPGGPFLSRAEALKTLAPDTAATIRAKNPKGMQAEHLNEATRPSRPVDNSPARPDALPNGIKEATAALSKPDDIKAIAAQYRVDPETGSYFEQPDIKQLDTEGRLTAGDKAELEAAQAAYEDGAAYGEALKAAVGCII